LQFLSVAYATLNKLFAVFNVLFKCIVVVSMLSVFQMNKDNFSVATAAMLDFVVYEF